MASALSVSELARLVKGRIIGHYGAETRVVGTCAVDNYASNMVSFVKNEKFGKLLANLQDAVILAPESLVELCHKHPQNTYIVVEDVLNAMMDIQGFFYRERTAFSEEGISPTAHVDRRASIGKKVYIGENVHIGKDVTIGNGVKIVCNACILDGVTIGENTYIGSGAYVHFGSRIGRDCIIHPGVAIGVDGFRFEQDIEQKRVRKWLHVGTVIIGDRVEIGANAAIARATYENSATIIGDDVKIDNLVHIAHNAKIGARTIIVTQTCVGGSCVIGEDVWIGIGASISNGVRIGDRAKVLLNAVVAYDVPDDEMVSGFYAMPHRQWKRVYQKLLDDTK